MAETYIEAFQETQLALPNTSAMDHMHDWQRCPTPLLAGLAVTEGEVYDRISIRDADEIKKHIGTYHALDVFARNCNIFYTLEEIWTGIGNRAYVNEVDICVSETLRGGVNFAEFLTRVFKLLLPNRLVFVQVNICPSFDTPVGVYLPDFDSVEQHITHWEI